MKEKKLNIDKILQNNRKINPAHLAKNLKVLGKLHKKGVNIGPDYQLGSPYAHPRPRSKDTENNGPFLRSG